MLEDSTVGEDGTQIPRGPLHVLLSSFGQFVIGTKSISRVQIINWKGGTGACNPCLTARIHPSGNSSPESKRNKVCSTVLKFKWKEVTLAQRQRNISRPSTNDSRRSSSRTNGLKTTRTRMTVKTTRFLSYGQWPETLNSMCVEPVVTLDTCF